MTAKDTAEPTLAITEQAIEKVRGFRAQSEDPESQALWVEVSGVSDGESLRVKSLKDGVRNPCFHGNPEWGWKPDPNQHSQIENPIPVP